MALATRGAAIVADAIVLVVTLMKTFRHTQHAAQIGVKMNISATLLRDGGDQGPACPRRCAYLGFTGSVYFLYVKYCGGMTQVHDRAFNSSLLVLNIVQLVTNLVVRPTSASYSDVDH